MNAKMIRRIVVAFSLLILVASSATSVPEDEQWKEQRDLERVKEPHERQPRIIGGGSTPQGSFEYFVRVDSYGQVFCGGVLVAPDVAMTAAHCFSSALSVVVNGYDNSNPNQLNRGQHFRGVESVLPHPNFNGENLENDVMLLKLTIQSTTLRPFESISIIPTLGREKTCLSWVWA
jgi:secreted trypsin-like serine protease